MANNYGDPLNRLIFSDDEMIGFQGSAGEMFAAGDLTDESQKMLCFGDYENKCDLTLPLQSQISEITCNNNNSSATSCANNGKIKKKRSGYEGDGEGSGAGAPAGKRRGGKKNKGESSSGNVHARGKKGKEKLGDRISALQHLVSPFGKTDTASVLHEAMGYIKFLHEQVQVLCSPYLQTPLSSSPALLHDGGNPGEDEQSKVLRSKGLCLVPKELVLQLANSNGADLWSPAAAMEKNAAASNKY
ncbi:transcription factor bHLH113-like [Apium graveolens]|uniref:transcription factor bHLH113-like n=1 Tax=Apium graveolens TaxID=4045 RepID=UPI003D78D781